MKREEFNFEKSAFVRGCVLNFNHEERSFYFKLCFFGKPQKNPKFLDYCKTMGFNCFRYGRIIVRVDDPELDVDFLDEAFQEEFDTWKKSYLTVVKR